MGTLDESIDDYLPGRKSLNIQQRLFIIKEVSRRIRSFFKRGILFIDNIDKVSEDHPEIVERWLIQAQGFIENVLWENKIYTIFVGPSFWQEGFGKSAEFSWFFDTHIYMQQWKVNHICELISNRLKSSVLLPDSKYVFEKYFSSDALKEIYKWNYGNPRYCLRAAKSCLYHGWEDNIDIISLQFVREHPHCIDGTLEESELMRHQSLFNRIVRDPNLSKAYRLLNNLFRTEKEKSMSLLDDIIILYDGSEKGSRIITNQHLLTDYEIIRRTGRRYGGEPTSKRSVDLVQPVRALITVLYAELDENAKTVKSFIIRQLGL